MISLAAWPCIIYFLSDAVPIRLAVEANGLGVHFLADAVPLPKPVHCVRWPPPSFPPGAAAHLWSSADRSLLSSNGCRYRHTTYHKRASARLLGLHAPCCAAHSLILAPPIVCRDEEPVGSRRPGICRYNEPSRCCRCCCILRRVRPLMNTHRYSCCEALPHANRGFRTSLKKTDDTGTTVGEGASLHLGSSQVWGYARSERGDNTVGRASGFHSAGMRTGDVGVVRFLHAGTRFCIQLHQRDAALSFDALPPAVPPRLLSNRYLRTTGMHSHAVEQRVEWCAEQCLLPLRSPFFLQNRAHLA